MFVAWIPASEIPDEVPGTAIDAKAIEELIEVEMVIGWWMDETADERLNCQTPDRMLMLREENLVYAYSTDGGTAMRRCVRRAQIERRLHRLVNP